MTANADGTLTNCGLGNGNMCCIVSGARMGGLRIKSGTNGKISVLAVPAEQYSHTSMPALTSSTVRHNRPFAEQSVTLKANALLSGNRALVNDIAMAPERHPRPSRHAAKFSPIIAAQQLDQPLSPKDFPDPSIVEAVRSRTEVIIGLQASIRLTCRTWPSVSPSCGLPSRRHLDRTRRQGCREAVIDSRRCSGT
jgi:hypothetical protein